MYSLCLQNATLHFPSNLTSSLLFPINYHKLSTKARFQCSIKTNNTNSKQVTNQKVLILWDLDNKPPRGPPYNAALSLKTLAERFGDAVSISAYTIRHSFFNHPQWQPDQNPKPNSKICRVCGHQCKSIFHLKIHFKQIHEMMYKKWLERLKSIKLDRSKVRFIRRRHIHNEAARTTAAPRVGFGLASELRRAGVFVKTVELGDKVNAADSSLKREIMSGGVDWLILVSDDSEYSEMLREVREMKLGNVVVVGDYWDRDLGRNADLWLPWIVVENGKVEKMDLMRRRTLTEDLDDELEEDENVDDEYTIEEEQEEDGFYVY
ncbi:C2H2 zinc finger protein [Trifolium repens]|nr:C2H2 zinc finger protein [Trifolium repens]